ncbi:MAG: SMC-Scp complex subunit ScpB [Planctomycetota bacterium]
MTSALPLVAAVASDAAVVAGAHSAVSAQKTSAPGVAASAQSAPLVETLDAASARSALDAQIGQMGGADDLVPDTVDLPPIELRGVIEGLLFVSTRPLTTERIAALLPGAQPAYLTGFLAGLADRYRRERRGWDLRQIGASWQLLTRSDFHAWVRQLDRKELPSRLTRSAMETLAIVAYKQPIHRGEIEDIRGVQSGPMLRQLMDLKLIQVVGRSEELLGKPMLYGTTDVFLDRFGLASSDDLPRDHEFG